MFNLPKRIYSIIRVISRHKPVVLKNTGFINKSVLIFRKFFKNQIVKSWCGSLVRVIFNIITFIITSRVFLIIKFISKLMVIFYLLVDIYLVISSADLSIVLSTFLGLFYSSIENLNSTIYNYFCSIIKSISDYFNSSSSSSSTTTVRGASHISPSRSAPGGKKGLL